MRGKGRGKEGVSERSGWTVIRLLPLMKLLN